MNFFSIISLSNFFILIFNDLNNKWFLLFVIQDFVGFLFIIITTYIYIYIYTKMH